MSQRLKGPADRARVFAANKNLQSSVLSRARRRRSACDDLGLTGSAVVAGPPLQDDVAHAVDGVGALRVLTDAGPTDVGGSFENSDGLGSDGVEPPLAIHGLWLGDNQPRGRPSGRAARQTPEQFVAVAERRVEPGAGPRVGAEAGHAGRDLVEVEDQVAGSGVLADPARLTRGGRTTDQVKRDGRGSQPVGAAGRLATEGLLACGVPVVAFLAKRAEVGPVEPKVRSVSDGDDVVHHCRGSDAVSVDAE